MKTKFYTTRDFPLMLRPEDAAVLGLTHHRQVSVYIAAKTGKAAMERLAELGYPREKVRIASGNQLDALIEAGQIYEDGPVILSDNYGRSQVARLYISETGERCCDIAGKLIVKPVFIAVTTED